MIGHLTQQLYLLVFPALSGHPKRTARKLRRLLRSVLPDREVNPVFMRFWQEFPLVQAAALTDVSAAMSGDPAANSHEEIIATYPGIFAVTICRLANILYRQQVPLLPRAMTEYAHSRTGIDLHPGACIGHSFFIDHGTGVVVGETAVIGSNVTLYHGVTLGALSPRDGQHLHGVRRHPTLEDNVTVYAGATILGGDTVIGHGVTIPAGAFVTASVPPHP